MKICVLGLDCAPPEIIFRDDRLLNIRQLMEGESLRAPGKYHPANYGTGLGVHDYQPDPGPFVPGTELKDDLDVAVALAAFALSRRRQQEFSVSLVERGGGLTF